MTTPTVSTDLLDYAPGSTAIITASGFAPGTTVMFEVDHTSGEDSGAGHTPWYVIDGGAGDLDGVANGVIRTTWYVNPDDSLGATFLLTAKSAGADGVFGTADDVTASTRFTDSGITATGVTVTLDESPGLQNATATPGVAGDDTDNDILVSALPAEFSGRLNALTTNAVPLGAALSGYTGAAGNTGSNAFTISPAMGASITNVRFVDSTGGALVGVDSGLLTPAGTKIYLYSDSVIDNIVLARLGNDNGTADPGNDTPKADGAIVFAAYIEETGSPVSGGKIWTVQYSALLNPIAGNLDDPVDLTGKIFVGTTQNLQFNLDMAPSGQNLFLMFTQSNPGTFVDGMGVTRITDPTIIATGMDPANQSTGVNISTGDTINTSQAGGPTTFGTNNQMVVVNEGLRFSFVTGARQDVTIPFLDQNEAKVEANIDFTAVFGARSASFDIVQLQSGKSAVVKITAFSTAAEPGVAFIDGYAGDATIAITALKVNGAAPAAGTATVSGGVWTISGIKAGDKIEYTTTVDHNRVLIENAGSGKGQASAAFDVGGFTLTQVTVASLEVGSKMIFEDDGPNIITTGAAPTLTVDETVLATDATASFAASFTPSFGTDGSGTVTYALGVVAGASGLTDTATGEAVNLSVTVGGVVQGKTAIGGLVVFEVSVAANGDVTLDQQRAVVHTNTGNHNDSTTLSAANLVTLTATDTDKDGDSAQATLNIGQNLLFKDDGPSITVSAIAPPDALVVDESNLALNASADFSDNFSNAPTYGADGAGTVTSAYALSVKSTGVDSGLDDVASGNSIFLYLESGQVVGRVGTSTTVANAAGAISFTVSVNATGTVTLDQVLAMKHPNAANPDDAISPSAADLIRLTRTDTITDKDGDTNTGSAGIDIAAALSFKDDGPSLAFGNLVGTGTINPQYGYWNSATGADGLGANGLDMVLSSFTIIPPGGGMPIPGASLNFSELAGSPNGSGAYLFAGSLTGDFDNNASTPNTTVDFTLTAFANGTYALDLVQGFGSSVTFSSVNGQLPAGGPDPVQTLMIPGQDVVFFAVNATAAKIGTTSIASAVQLGEADYNEAFLQTNSSMVDSDGISANGNQPGNGTFPFINDTYLMNVSTSGIGVGNNVLNGDNSELVSAADESFVINPKSLLTSMKVFIDNSVGGYTPNNESLLYTIYYADGSTSAQTKVEAGDLTAEAGGQVSFVLNAGVGAAKLIDAVQLTMARGAIKIPVIEFTVGAANIASDVKLDFLASLFDKDGDVATSAFTASLNANKLAPSAFDYVLAGTAGVRDAFDINLPATQNKYQVTGFDTGDVSLGQVRDKLVFLGSGTVGSIDNSGTDSIVTVNETTGGQVTTVTVVGVDLLPTDIAFQSVT